MSLPVAWIDKIFTKLTLVYGRDFLGRWEGLDLNAVKSDWAHELAGFERFPEGIAYALTHLDPIRPPTVFQFRDLARKAPLPEAKQLPAPLASPAVIAEQFKRLAPRLKCAQPSADKRWAVAIMSRVEAGEQLSPTTVRFAREAVDADGGKHGSESYPRRSDCAM